MRTAIAKNTRLRPSYHYLYGNFLSSETKYMWNKLVVILFFFVYSIISAQERFLSPDDPANCKGLREGKFIKQNTGEKNSRFTVKKDILKQYSNNGKSYIKYKIKFINDCEFTGTITAKTDGQDLVRIGETVQYKIIETRFDQIRLQRTIYNNTEEFIVQKSN